MHWAIRKAPSRTEPVAKPPRPGRSSGTSSTLFCSLSLQLTPLAYFHSAFIWWNKILMCWGKKSLVIQPNFHMTVTSSPYLAIIFNACHRNTQHRKTDKWEQMLEGETDVMPKTVEVFRPLPFSQWKRYVVISPVSQSVVGTASLCSERIHAMSSKPGLGCLLKD